MIKRIIISLLVALITNTVLYGSYTIYADNNRSLSFRDSDLHYKIIFDLYHQEMNDLFNDKIDALKELLEDDAFMKDLKKRKNFLVPENIEKEKDSLLTIVQKCEENGENISSYCVSMEALYIYLEFVRQVESIKDSLHDGSNSSIQGRIDELIVKGNAIEKEVDKSKAIMEGTVAAYNEFAIAYPLHRKYQEIIENLVKYKLSLKDIRKEVMLFPSKFIDSTSSQCQ